MEVMAPFDGTSKVSVEVRPYTRLVMSIPSGETMGRLLKRLKSVRGLQSWKDAKVLLPRRRGCIGIGKENAEEKVWVHQSTRASRNYLHVRQEQIHRLCLLVDRCDIDIPGERQCDDEYRLLLVVIGKCKKLHQL